MNLQNKQGTGGGLPIGSPMLKLIGEHKKFQSCGRIFSHTFLIALPPLFIKKDDDPLFLWEVGDWFPKWKGGRRFTCASTIFPFG